MSSLMLARYTLYQSLWVKAGVSKLLADPSYQPPRMHTLVLNAQSINLALDANLLPGKTGCLQAHIRCRTETFPCIARFLIQFSSL